MDKLLIVADLGESRAAISRGLELALKLGLAAKVVAFTYAPLEKVKVSAAKRKSMQKRLLHEREKAVQADIDKYCQDEQEIDLTVIWEKNIVRCLNRLCAGGGYAVVVKTGNRTDSLLHTSTDWQLIRECPAPVLLVAKKKWHRVKPVLVTLDLSSTLDKKRALNRKVLGMAQTLATTLGVELKIITAVEIPRVLSDLDLVDPLAYVRDAKVAMKPQIRELAQDYGIPESAFTCKRGDVEKVIGSQAAKLRAQIVVLGTVARKGVKARLLGNTAEKVLNNLKTDVLAIKP